MNKQSKIKPIHLALTGMVIIILGILIPSMFIDAFSAMGFSLIIGLLVLLSAYVFFSINTIRSKGTHAIKWLLIPVVIIGVGIGFYYIHHSHQQNLKSKIYTKDEVVNFSDFTLSITKVAFEPVELPTDQSAISEFGTASENCNRLSNAPSWEYTGFGTAIGMSGWEMVGISDHAVCEMRNESRDALSDYEKEYEKLTVSYVMSATDTTDTKEFNISLLPDSGRDPTNSVDGLRGNQFFKGGATRKKTETINGITHETYNYDNDSAHSDVSAPQYKPYIKTDLGGEINTGLDRSGQITTDVRRTEQSIDLKVTYNSEVRIIRVSR